MEFTYIFTEQDFNFYKRVTLESLRSKVKLENLYHIFLFLIWITMTFAGFIRLGYEAFVFQWVVFTVVLFLLFLITNGKRLLLKRYLHVTYQEKDIEQNMLIKLEDEGIYLKDFEDFEYYLFLYQIRKVIKTNEYLVIYTKKENMIIPLRVFKTQNEQDDFIQKVLSKTTKPLQIIEREYE